MDVRLALFGVEEVVQMGPGVAKVEILAK